MTAVGKTLMVQGTSSSVGKSLLVTALCRIFRDLGINVAPFKAQNMSLNAAVTPDGLEIGRAQAVQAEAARIAPRVEMNPILLKPEGDQRSQLVLMGRAVGHVTAASYFRDDRQSLRHAIAESLATLRRAHDLVIIEGAGSPAEVNLMHRDLVNMHVAKLADAPVILVGDIDRGGVFASLLGTLALLDPEDRDRVRALLVNKFRGDASLFRDGVTFLEQRSGKPVLGVVPYLQRLAIADEDSQSIDERRATPNTPGSSNTIVVAVVRLPRMSNHDDVLALEHEPNVVVRFVDQAPDIDAADLVIVPGSKSTVADLMWLRMHGIDHALQRRARRGGPILGICGGCQMLGDAIHDPEHVESAHSHTQGLGLLPFITSFQRAKTTAQVHASPRPNAPFNLLTGSLPADLILTGYEIHHGQLRPTADGEALFAVRRHDTGDAVSDGASSLQGHVIGTMIHGLLDNAALRANLLAHLRAHRGVTPIAASQAPTRDQEYDRLARAVRDHIDMPLLQRLVGR